MTPPPMSDDNPYFLALDVVPVGICTLDRDLRVLWWNRCLEEWTGVKRGEIVGQCISERYENFDAKFRARVGGVFSGGPPVVFSSQLHRYLIRVEFRDQQIQRQHCVVKPVVHPERNETVAMLLIQDVTDQFRQSTALRQARDQAVRELELRKAAEEKMRVYTAQIEDANNELRLFASIASHDLRAPLRRIVMFGECIEDAKLDGDTADMVARMRRSAARMHDLVADLATYSRLACSDVDFVEVSIGDVVADVLADLSVDIDEAGAKIEVDDALDEQVTIRGNPPQLRQLMQNLIANGVKYRARDRTAHVEVRSVSSEDPNVIALSVKDNGIGIAPEYFEKIFQPFQRLHGGAEYKGTGMGLAICRRIAESHGGALAVESSLGEGSTFCVTLPTATSKSNAA